MKPIVRRDRSLQRRLLLAGEVCVGVALLLAVAGLALGLSGSSAGRTPTTTSVVAVVAPAPSTTTTRTPTTRPPTLLERALADGGSLAVQVTGEGVDVYAHPGGEAAEVTHFAPTGQDGAATTFLVVDESHGRPAGNWYKVLLPKRPNGTTGWVRAADVVAVPLTCAVRISLSDHRLDLYQQGELLASYPVAVGKPGTATPTGDFYMTAKVQPARVGGPYGVLAIGLSAYSDTLTDWVGGGQVAIHGTNDPARVGTDASHGCVRMKNEDILLLSASTPLGTPVVITP